MKAQRWALRAGEALVRLASRRLPPRARQQRYREWAAELPVILNDPEVRPAVRRLVRMLWFAADTLRGASRARYRGAHDGGREGYRALAALILLPVLLALLGCFVYAMIFGRWLGYSGFFFGYWLADLIFHMAGRRPGKAAHLWLSAGMLAFSGGRLVQVIARPLGWGHPLLFSVIDYCAIAVSVVCIGMAVALVVRSRPRARVSG